jgi:[ribosomal protein S5]-alanine N-acetyltransferase
MEIATARLVLREFEERDYDGLYEMYRDPEMRRYEGTLLDAPQIRQNLNNFLADRDVQPRDHFRLAITTPPNDQARGWIKLGLNIAEIDEYEIGWGVHRQEWGKGFATEAARAMLHFAFARLNAHRVVAFCHAGNTVSVRVMEKLGMQREGLLRQVRLIDNQWYDEMVYAILDSDYPHSPLDVPYILK